MIEIDYVAHAMQDGEEQRGHGTDLVECHVRVERNVLMDGGLAQSGDQIP